MGYGKQQDSGRTHRRDQAGTAVQTQVSLAHQHHTQYPGKTTRTRDPFFQVTGAVCAYAPEAADCADVMFESHQFEDSRTG
jgi:hypothetical protein